MADAKTKMLYVDDRSERYENMSKILMEAGFDLVISSRHETAFSDETRNGASVPKDEQIRSTVDGVMQYAKNGVRFVVLDLILRKEENEFDLDLEDYTSLRVCKELKGRDISIVLISSFSYENDDWNELVDSVRKSGIPVVKVPSRIDGAYANCPFEEHERCKSSDGRRRECSRVECCAVRIKEACDGQTR